MSSGTTLLQQSPYLRSQRQFPSDLEELSNQVDHAYIDIANKVNSRTIGIFAINNQIVTGEQYYLSGSATKQQTLRQIYEFTAAGNIAHGINLSTITEFTDCYGSYTDGTNHYGVLYASSVIIAGQVSFYITPMNIIVQADAGAPPIISGIIVLTWISQF